jgi:hypothetical protein
MTQEEIINGSKLIAEYLNWIYIPFEPNLGNKLGWFAPAPKGLTIIYPKQGYPYFIDGVHYKWVCRNHKDLRFWNSLDALVPVIQKIEREKVNVRLNNNGCHFYYRESENSFESYDLPNWSNNIFKVIVKYLERNENTTRT